MKVRWSHYYSSASTALAFVASAMLIFGLLSRCDESAGKVKHRFLVYLCVFIEALGSAACASSACAGPDFARFIVRSAVRSRMMRRQPENEAIQSLLIHQASNNPLALTHLLNSIQKRVA